MAFLDLTNVSVIYKETAALESLTLSVDRGEFVSLLGPSGCGKTTALRVIAGLQTPTSGCVSLDGKPLTDGRSVVPPEKRHMGMVFQSYAVWPHMSVRQNVEFGLRRQRVRAAEATRQAQRMLEIVGLGSMGEKYPNQLSGGQQQRVALARSLVVKPAIMLLDEPLSNLDARLRESMCKELKRLQRETGITFVYVTHDRTEALAMSDRVAVMSAGHLLQYASPREVFERPCDPVVASLLGDINLLNVEFVDRGRVVVGGHTLSVVSTEQGTAMPTSRGPAVAAFRPHVAQLAATPHPSVNNLPCTVAAVTYSGVSTEYTTECFGQQIRVVEQRGSSWRPGDEAFVLIEPKDLLMYPLREPVESIIQSGPEAVVTSPAV